MTFERQLVRPAAIAGLLAVWLLPAAVSAQPEEVWRTTGLKQPESVLFDPERDVLYVSNVNGSPTEKDGNGFISKLTRDGRVETAEWVTGLDAPKGMALAGDRLYVSDIDRLVAIDVTAGKVVDSYPAAGAKFLNDVASDGSGRVYVSDMMTDTIYALDPGGALEPWLRDEALMSPNGLLAEEDRLVVAAWGVTPEGSQTAAPGPLQAVDYQSKTVRSLSEPLGTLDGVEATAEGSYLVTDWTAGALYRIRPSGEAERLLDLNQGSADLEYVAEEGLALIPMMMDGAVVAYRID